MARTLSPPARKSPKALPTPGRVRNLRRRLLIQKKSRFDLNESLGVVKSRISSGEDLRQRKADLERMLIATLISIGQIERELSKVDD